MGAAESLVTLGGTPNTGVVNSARANLPKYYISTRVDLWGDRDVEQGMLFALAFGCCMNQLGFNTAVLSVGTTKIVSSQALHEKFARVEMTSWWGEDANIASINFIGPLALLNVGAGLRSLLNAVVPQSDKKIYSTNIGHGRPVILDQTGAFIDNPTMGYQNHGNFGLLVGNKGATLCSLVAQILEDPNQTPLVPSIPMPLN